MRFSEQTIVVTGGSKGIGRATALRFASEGANIIITSSRDTTETTKTLSEIREHGVDAHAFPCDVGDESSVSVFFEQVHAVSKKIHGIIHSAGISPNTQLEDQTAAEWNRVLSTNLTGSFLIAKYAEKLLIDNGNIVMISSSNGINSFDPISAHYDASKAGVIMLVRDLAKEYASRGIRVNSVAPGWINTTLNDTLPDDMRANETAKIYLGRWGTPEEVASVCAFLASSDASFITGTTLLVDGGYG